LVCERQIRLTVTQSRAFPHAGGAHKKVRSVLPNIRSANKNALNTQAVAVSMTLDEAIETIDTQFSNKQVIQTCACFFIFGVHPGVWRCSVCNQVLVLISLVPEIWDQLDSSKFPSGSQVESIPNFVIELCYCCHRVVSTK